jgi:hypothetical protein
MSEEKAIGSFDESLQRLYMEFSKDKHTAGIRSRPASKAGTSFDRDH